MELPGNRQRCVTQPLSFWPVARGGNYMGHHLFSHMGALINHDVFHHPLDPSTNTQFFIKPRSSTMKQMSCLTRYDNTVNFQPNMRKTPVMTLSCCCHIALGSLHLRQNTCWIEWSLNCRKTPHLWGFFLGWPHTLACAWINEKEYWFETKRCAIAAEWEWCPCCSPTWKPGWRNEHRSRGEPSQNPYEHRRRTTLDGWTTICVRCTLHRHNITG